MPEFPSNFQSRLLSWVKVSQPQNTVLNQAIHYALAGAGKHLRPRFVYESGALVSLPETVLEPVAFALEMVHGFSLVHDDLPCLDNDDFRRGAPTTHKKFGEAQGLLAGDALLAFAFETFAHAAPSVNPSAYQNAFLFFCKSIGSKGMIGGQSLEVELKEPTTQQFLHIQSLKTTALFRASILIPLLLAGKNEADPLYQNCLHYADAFGFAFQIADDLEDEIQDAAQKNKNILSLYGREVAIKMAHEGLSQAPISSSFSATALLIQTLASKR